MMTERRPSCLVFGGTGALGRAVCRALHEASAQLAFTYHESRQVADELCGQLTGTHALSCDLRDVATIADVVEQAVEALDGLDAVVQCAALGHTRASSEPGPTESMLEIDEQKYERLMDLNVKSNFFVGRASARAMRQTGGNLVLIGSIDGIKPMPGPVHYATSKAALQGMTRSMAKEVGRFGIRVNLIAPGVLKTGLTRALPPALVADYLAHCGLGRLGRPDEIANLVRWLALENTCVTGQTIIVDGAL